MVVSSTPTEAAAVSAILWTFVGLFIYKTITFKDVPRILADSVSQTAVVMFIVGTASLFAWILTVTGLAAQASNVLISVSSGNKYIFLLIVNIILLIAGCFIDANSACYILVPILVPVATALGINPIHLWLYHDRKHGNRNGYTACRCKPVCWMWYCKDLTERDIHSSSSIHRSIDRGTVTYNLCTYNLNVPAESAWIGT